MADKFIGADILSVPRLKEQLLLLRYKSGLQLNSFLRSGILTVDNQLRALYNLNTGTVSIPTWNYRKEAIQIWNAKSNTVIHDIPHKKQKAVIVGIIQGWGANILANYVAGGMKPSAAINMVINEDIPVAINQIFYDAISGALSSSSASKLTYTVDGVIKSSDYKKALGEIWGDRKSEAPVSVIMHSALDTTLELELDNKFKTNFMAGVEVILDDEITDNGDGTYSMFLFKKNTIKWTDLLNIGTDARWVEKSETINHGQKSAGYRERFGLAINGFSFEGTLADDVSATEAELKLGTNWQLVDDIKRVGIAVIKAKAYNSDELIRQTPPKQPAKA